MYISSKQLFTIAVQGAVNFLSFVGVYCLIYIFKLIVYALVVSPLFIALYMLIPGSSLIVTIGYIIILAVLFIGRRARHGFDL